MGLSLVIVDDLHPDRAGCSLIRILSWPFRSPLSASKRLRGKAARSFSEVAASRRSSFIRADRSIPENALTRWPAANSLDRLSRWLTIIPESSRRYELRQA